jgi:2-methylaconitate cis-trans-isomerase PrpF
VAICEAEERGLAEVLGLEFQPAPQALSSVLTFCDMTTSPDGGLVPVERRLAEIHDRYGSGHLVSRSIQRATPMILRAVEQVGYRAARTAWRSRPEAGRRLHRLKVTWPQNRATDLFEVFEYSIELEFRYGIER